MNTIHQIGKIWSNILIIIDKRLHGDLKKYHLQDETLAAAASGMSSYSDLDKRCITFTIHLTDPSKHTELCRHLFYETEQFLTSRLGKKPKVSHSGLASFLDVNGSKFSGADRDFRQSHCHGCIFTPHCLNEQDVVQLIGKLIHAARSSDGVKCSPHAIHLRPFDRQRHTATLLDWVGYAQKEAARVTTSGFLGVFLPFDMHTSYSPMQAEFIKKRRDVILQTLRGPDRFKVCRGVCSERQVGTRATSSTPSPDNQNSFERQ